MSKQIQIDYTSRDFDGIRASLLAAIPYFNPEWTDHNASNNGIVLLELFAYVADGLHFYIDRAANECFLPTALSRTSVANMVKLIDYEMDGPTPASVDLVIANGSTSSVVVPSGTRVQTSGDTITYFETTAEVTIAAGDSETVGAEEGQTVEDLYNILESRTFLTFSLTRSGVYLDSIDVYIDEGSGEVLWTEVDSFLDSTESSRDYVVVEGLDGTLDIRLGDGAKGKIPAAGAIVRVVYRIGVGAAGNVGAATLTTFVTAVPAGVTVNNPSAASGGRDGETIEEAKILGPASLRALYRAVTPEDYENLVLAEFSQIKKARAIVHDAHNIESGCCTIRLYVYPAGGGQPTSLLQQQIYEFLEGRKSSCTVVTVAGFCTEQVRIEGKVRVLDGFDLDTVQTAVIAAVQAIFEEDSPLIGFGLPLHQSSVYDTITGVQGVESADLSVFTLLPQPVLSPWRGDAVLSDIDVSPTAAPDAWEVTFTDATNFAVRGSNAGLIGTGQVGIEFNSTIIFTITNPGPDPMLAGDKARFRTTDRLGAVTPLESCLLALGSLSLTFEQGPEQVVTTRRCVD